MLTIQADHFDHLGHLDHLDHQDHPNQPDHPDHHGGATSTYIIWTTWPTWTNLSNWKTMTILTALINLTLTTCLEPLGAKKSCLEQPLPNNWSGITNKSFLKVCLEQYAKLAQKCPEQQFT